MRHPHPRSCPSVSPSNPGDCASTVSTGNKSPASSVSASATSRQNGSSRRGHRRNWPAAAQTMRRAPRPCSSRRKGCGPPPAGDCPAWQRRQARAERAKRAGVKSPEPADRGPKEKERSLVARPAIPQLERHLPRTDSGYKPDELGNIAGGERPRPATRPNRPDQRDGVGTRPRVRAIRTS